MEQKQRQVFRTFLNDLEADIEAALPKWPHSRLSVVLPLLQWVYAARVQECERKCHRYTQIVLTF
jgi:hypothetical protein